MNDNNPFDFLLKTESYEPLIDLVDQLSKKIRENEALISKLTYHIDINLELPNVPVTKNDDESDPINIHEITCDNLEHILNQKYSLGDIKLPRNCEVQESNPRIKKLIEDNLKLRVLKKQKDLKNRQLLKVINEYDQFITEDILPALRRDVTNYHIEVNKEFKESQLNRKYKTVGLLWQRYVKYFQYLCELTETCKNLVEVLGFETNEHEISMLQQKLNIVDQLRSFIENTSSPL
ncbi:uncharacterized protein PRCAT00002184001 [Priceomyces carsonii]|uniref:uncharacterized protein n=1 Tax=Priceomyces carsonii TaxID=28549 RepID=UPI002EDA665F|nr:unnamed protein product [Priceomyces carsonii]